MPGNALVTSTDTSHVVHNHSAFGVLKCLSNTITCSFILLKKIIYTKGRLTFKCKHITDVRPHFISSDFNSFESELKLIFHFFMWTLKKTPHDLKLSDVLGKHQPSSASCLHKERPV